METLTRDAWEHLFADCATTAWRLKTRDLYTDLAEAEDFAVWRTGRQDPGRDARRRRAWLDLIRTTSRRGVQMRRALIVSEPVSDYVRFEYETMLLNVAAGEDVRWLPRPLAAEIALPGTDFWVFDGAIVVFSHYNGDGALVGSTKTTDAATVAMCVAAFEAVWRSAAPHDEYRPA